MYEKVSQVGH